ncbi:hypothetical protein QJS04_geneDACA024150 [Acorus gramineus]|uniref:Uncharacterized protein n=1 Tax=Acorus gramineus TaxID=55184 RepID=A0AAV9A0L7_ACOGR|nr:hypothetical protein QJS04_geneDACA024150 [Acorus gramineus]
MKMVSAAEEEIGSSDQGGFDSEGGGRRFKSRLFRQRRRGLRGRLPSFSFTLGLFRIDGAADRSEAEDELEILSGSSTSLQRMTGAGGC